MKTKEIRELIEKSGKRTIVHYEGKDRRKSFSESNSKMELIKSLIEGQEDKIIEILNEQNGRNI